MVFDFHSIIIIKISIMIGEIKNIVSIGVFVNLSMGINKMISNSRAKNKNRNDRKFIDVDILNEFILLNPHSNGDWNFLSDFFPLFMVIIHISKIIIMIVQNVHMIFMDISSFNITIGNCLV